MKKKADPHKLTSVEALALLVPHLEGKKKRVHTMQDTGMALMGCDVDLTSIKKRLKESEDIRLAGPNMSAMGHGLAFLISGIYTFLKTDMAKVNALCKERGI